MKRLTASEIRRNWFRVLDEVAAGEVVVVERKGRRIVLRREEPEQSAIDEALPDYRGLLDAAGIEDADLWSWDWEGGELIVVDEDRA